MGYVPRFTNDLFISYRHASNESHDNWIDAFCEALRASLTELVGNVTIWRDEAAIRAGDQWRPEIAAALDSTAIFLAIVSKTYFDSDVCRIELDQFLGRVKDASETIGRRIVPVFKQPTKQDQEVPPELDEYNHHDFFRWDPKGSHRFREFTPAGDDETAAEFSETLARLAQDLMAQLEELKGEARRRSVGTVYLARVGPELHAEREKLRADLQQRGYLVVPEREYLWNAADFRARVSGQLAMAELCVHLIARTASIEPKTAERARLQLELAAEAMKGKGKPPPLVWIQPANETHAAARPLIDYVEQELSNEGVEYWHGSLEDFKTQIYDQLPRTPASTSATRPSPGAPVARDIALVMEQGDLAAAEDLYSFLVDTLHLETRRIKLSGSEPGDPTSLARTLARTGRTIVFWGGQSEEWLNDLLSLDALAGQAGKERLCVYAAGPGTPEKRTFRTSRARTIQGTSALNDAELRDFLA